MEKTYTGFCQFVTGMGTIWIGSFEATDEDSAAAHAVSECAADWDTTTDEVHLLGLAEGDVNILRWNDLNDG